MQTRNMNHSHAESYVVAKIPDLPIKRSIMKG